MAGPLGNSAGKGIDNMAASIPGQLFFWHSQQLGVWACLWAVGVLVGNLVMDHESMVYLENTTYPNYSMMKSLRFDMED